MSTVSDLLVAAHDPASGRPLLGSDRFGLTLAAALLADLATAGRIDELDRRIVVLDPAPTGDRLADGALDRIRTARPARAQRWVQRLSGRGLRRRAVDAAVAAGLLTRTTARLLGLFPVARYPHAPGGEDVRRLLDPVARGMAAPPVDTRTAALCAVVAGAGAERRMCPGVPRREAHRRLLAAAAPDWIPDALRRAIAEQAGAASTGAITGGAAAGG